MCFLFAGRQQDQREVVVCLPSGHSALGAAGSIAALECVCLPGFSVGGISQARILEWVARSEGKLAE